MAVNRCAVAIELSFIRFGIPKPCSVKRKLRPRMVHQLFTPPYTSVDNVSVNSTGGTHSVYESGWNLRPVPKLSEFCSRHSLAKASKLTVSQRVIFHSLMADRPLIPFVCTGIGKNQTGVLLHEELTIRDQVVQRERPQHVVQFSLP